jgi:hypothetical protein
MVNQPKVAILSQRVAVFVLTAALSVPLLVCAQTNSNSAAAEDKNSSVTGKTEPKARPIPLRGKLVSINTAGRTLTVGKRTFCITSQTKLWFSDKQPARFENAVVGESVTGSYTKAADGRLIANSIYFRRSVPAKTPVGSAKTKSE